MRTALLTLAAIALPMSLAAETFTVGDLAVTEVVAKTTPATAISGAGYLSIMNSGQTADRLIAVEAAFPRVMIHDTRVENDIATMFHVDAVDIAPGEMVTFAPGGKHIMFMGLDGDPFEEGEEIPARLIFENAGALDVMFTVRTLEQIIDGAGDHAGHGN